MMKKLRAIWQNGVAEETRPFYIIITITLFTTSALTLFELPDPMPVARLPLFTGLLILHLALHWLSGYWTTHRPWRGIYLPLQGGLALALALVSQQPELAMTLFVALIAETLGLFGLTRTAAAGVAGCLFLTAASFYLLGGLPLLEEWANTVTSVMFLAIVFMVLYQRQSEARAQSQSLLAELETAHHQLADYAAQVESLTLAAERQRMARELHDTLAQGVAGLILQLEAANNHLENERFPRAQSIIQQSMKRARSTLADARAAIDNLRVENRAFSETVRRQTHRFTQATGIPCHLVLELPAETAVSATIADHAERMIGEGLANITRHAQADNVWLEITQSTDRLTIDIRDDGQGFDPAAAQQPGHYGLLGLRERARLVKGTFELTSQAATGTHLHITLPLEAV